MAADQSMNLAQGAFLAEGADRRVLNACRATGELTIEAVLRPANLRQGGPGRIISFSRDASHRNFTLGQEGDHLVLRLRTPQTGRNGVEPELTLCTLGAAGRLTHVIVTYSKGQVACFRDGKNVFESREVTGDFSNWEPCYLLFGDEWTGERDWAGTLEGIALYNRALPPHEAIQHMDAYRPRLVDRPAIDFPKQNTKVPARQIGAQLDVGTLLGTHIEGAKIVAIQGTDVLTIDLPKGN